MGRLLHRIAFRAGTAQHALSDVEETLYAGRIEGITADDPVFIAYERKSQVRSASVPAIPSGRRGRRSGPPAGKGI